MKRTFAAAFDRRRLPGFVRKLALLLVGVLAMSAGVLWGVYEVVLERQLAMMHDSALRRLELAANELAAPVARFEYLPALLETTPAVMQLLAAPSAPQWVDAANRALAGINAVAGADMLFVLAPTGLALAAADWHHPETTVGHWYDYRPYVTEALAQGRGRFFGIGATSQKPGYFLSYALKGGERILGVATVKIDLEPVERAWAIRRGELFVTDAHGVVILATRADWKFRALTPLTDAARAQIAAERAYPPDPPPLPWVHAPGELATGRRIVIDDQEHLLTTRMLPTFGWTLHTVEAVTIATTSARNAAMVAALGAAVICLLGVAAWQSRRAAMQKLAAQAQLQAAYATLEQRVTERTAQLTELNTSLAAEVESRKAIERTLQATQEELVHAAKMAVLGQLSAGLAHELNQPLAALRTLSDNAIVLIDQQRIPETRGNLERITLLVGRLGELTRRLKSFAHKPGNESVPTPVDAALSNAHALLAERLRRHDIGFERDVVPAKLCAQANPALLEQILVNLMTNAIDAMAGCALRRLRIAAREVGGIAEIAVSDSGRGIAPDMQARLFEAFATSKPRGAGLGLGLMISQRIAKDFGGRIRATNNPEGGATFIVELPVADSPGPP